MKTTLSLAVLAMAGVASAQLFTDDFNRPDGPLGSPWSQISGTDQISGNVVNGAGGNGLSLVDAGAFSASYDQMTVSADVTLLDNSTTLTYVALALGHNGATGVNNGVFVKLQRQAAVDGFSHIGFYTGAGSNGVGIVTTGTNFQVIANPFRTGRFTIKMTSATNLYTGVDTNFDSVDDMSWNSTLVFPTLVVGNRAGLHVWGNLSQIDNFRAEGIPEPATMLALGAGAAVLMRRRRRS